MKSRTLLLTLKVFSATGGIEKVCRVAGKALYEWSVTNNTSFAVFSMHDHTADADENRYFPRESFCGFGNRRWLFIWQALRAARSYDVVLLSHINLLPVARLIRFFYPQKKIILFAHGIEIWGELNGFKKWLLRCCNFFLPVSQYTADKIVEMHGIRANQCKVLNNALDPYLPLGKEYTDKASLKARYGLTDKDLVLFTLTRLSSKERYKGYDKVLQALVALNTQFAQIKYLIAGSFDEEERNYLIELATSLNVQNQLIIAGFIPDEDLVAHFSMADVYVMPSMKEGFGIVFIEAMFYGLPVIGGNRDGSVDALANGSLGMLVDPLNVDAIRQAIAHTLNERETVQPNRSLLLEKFSYTSYKKRLEHVLFDVN